MTNNNLLTGHVELKSPGTGARPEHFKGHNKDQWQRFKALPNLIEATLNLQPQGADLLGEVCASELFSRDELPSPSNEERKPPNNLPATGEQAELLSKPQSTEKMSVAAC